MLKTLMGTLLASCAAFSAVAQAQDIKIGFPGPVTGPVSFLDNT